MPPPRTMPSTVPPDLPSLRGTEVHVFQEGSLLYKPTFLRPFRPVTVNLKATHLRLTDPTNFQLRSFSLIAATLTPLPASRRLFLDLASGLRLHFQAQTRREYAQWLASFTDAIEWSFHRFYTLHEPLGSGSFATVHRAEYKPNGEQAAVKIIPLERLAPDDWRYLQTELEVAILARHPNIVTGRDLFRSTTHVHIVLEYLPGGTLQTFVNNRGKLPEPQARNIFADILRALTYLHRLGFVHRDLKPENILCSSKTEATPVKLADFGLSRRVSLTDADSSDQFARESSIGPGGLMMTPVGTPNFVAPEVLASLPYGREVDLFAAGVILFWILSGQLPFSDSEPERLSERIRKTEYAFDAPVWQTISGDAKNLITNLLQRSPCARITAAAALAHPWMTCATIGASCKRLDSGPGEQIVVRKWTADPGLEGSQPSSDGKSS